MKERFYYQMRRRTKFEESLLQTPVIENNQVTEPYIRFMQLVARGYFNHEIVLHPSSARQFICRIVQSGIDFPRTSEWDVSVTERRVIRAMQGATSLEQVIKKTKLDSNTTGIRKHIRRIQKKGRGGEVPDVFSTLSQANTVKVSRSARDIKVCQNNYT